MTRSPQKAEPREKAKDFKYRHKQQSDPLVMWLLVGSGVLLVVALVIVAIAIMSSDKKPSPAKPSHKEPAAPVNPVDNKKPAVNEGPAKPEKKSAAAVKNTNPKKGKPDVVDKNKKDKADGLMPKEPDRDVPIPIPGVPPSKPADPPM
jgi:hypothetical protein